MKYAALTDANDVQLALRGLMWAPYTVKPLYVNPTGPRPGRRTDGFDRQGPYALQPVPGKAKPMAAPINEPPPAVVPPKPTFPPEPPQAAPARMVPPPPKAMGLTECP